MPDMKDFLSSRLTCRTGGDIGQVDFRSVVVQTQGTNIGIADCGHDSIAPQIDFDPSSKLLL
jgi:hypothetical protein